jgi:hypothetical protein
VLPPDEHSSLCTDALLLLLLSNCHSYHLLYSERQHVPVQEYARNLAAMVHMARAAGISRIVLLTPPPVGDEARVRHQQKVGGSSSSSSSNQACRQL